MNVTPDGLKGDPDMPRKKAKEIQTAKRRLLVSEHLKEGLGYREIVFEIKKLGFKISLGTVSSDVAEILQDWRRSRISNIDDRIHSELDRLLEIDKDARGEWFKGVNGRTKMRVKKEIITTLDGVVVCESDGTPRFDVVEEITETMVPDVRFLEVRRGISHDIRKLYGADKPAKMQFEDVGQDNASASFMEKLDKSLDEKSLALLACNLDKHIKGLGKKRKKAK